ncbi:MAG: hypothetical protein R6V62_03620 [Candidatus Fermentibacteraceae bacterium]
MNTGLIEALMRLIEKLRAAEMRLLAQGFPEFAREVRVRMTALSRFRDALITRRLRQDSEALAALTENLDRCSAELALYLQDKVQADRAMNSVIGIVTSALAVLCALTDPV